ncbi:MAG TPA: polysaccharide deacetylase family protein [Candidatus Avidesulfovibrio excrementigallinarum]|nr:polysaccharide deacetylase family protein [Candidatus Avidesulfovibrio excrementigallinarum]
MMLLFDLFRTRLAPRHPLLPALLCVLLCGACAQDAQTPDRHPLPTTTTAAPEKHTQATSTQAPRVSSSQNKARPTTPKAVPATPRNKPAVRAQRPQKRPRASLPAIPAPGPSQSNFITANTLEYLGQKHQLCALTFDDGPTRYTPQLLQLLRERGIKATFFLLGSKVRSRPDLVRRIVAEGHEVANHSYSHPKLSRLSEEKQREEIAAVQALFHKLGVEGRFLRPPYGSFNSATLRVAEDLNLDVVLWSVDTNDWRHTLSIDGMSSRRGHDRPTRGVFLFHDTHLRTIKALPVLIDYLEASQCRFVTLSEYMGKPPLSGLKPQIAPVAAPSPEDQALPHQFPADDGSDDVPQTQTAPSVPSKAAASPAASSTEVVIPLQRDSATPAPAVPLPANNQNGTGNTGGPAPSGSQSPSGAPNRIPITWDPAPTSPVAAPAKPETLPQAPGASGSPAASQPQPLNGQLSPVQGAAPAPVPSASATAPAGETQTLPLTQRSADKIQSAVSASHGSTKTDPAASAIKQQKGSPEQTLKEPSDVPSRIQQAVKGQSPAQAGPAGKAAPQNVPASGAVKAQQPGTSAAAKPTPAENKAPQNTPAQNKEEPQHASSFWELFDF